MSAFLVGLRQILHRPWLLAALAALASAVLLLAGSVGVALQQMKESESAQMNAQGERFLERLEQVFGQLRQGVDQLHSLPLRGCDSTTLAPCFRPKAMFCSTVMCGNSAYDWNIMLMGR